MNQITNSIKTSNIVSISKYDNEIELQAIKVDNQLPSGYTNLTHVTVANRPTLFAYNRDKKSLDIYIITDSAGSFELVVKDSDSLKLKDWDLISSFVLGNRNYLMTYEKSGGYFGFYEINSDLTLSENPYLFANKRDSPTQNFTTVEAFESLGLMYICCYDSNSGTVAAFSLDVIASTKNGTPPLNMLNVWYHHWAKYWENFVFFKLGCSNFFFKINKGKLNVNIDHIQDNPAKGSVEVGSYLQNQLPNAKDVTIASLVPWENGEPHLVTYDSTSQEANLYRIHADCQGWTSIKSTKIEQATIIVTYRINDTSYILFYN